MLLSLLLVLTAYGSVRALRLVRSPATPVAEGSEARAWSFATFSWSLFVLGVWVDVGAWNMLNWVTGLADTVSVSSTNYYSSCSDMCIPMPVVYSIYALYGAVMFILPLSLLLMVLRRPGRAFPPLVERWLCVAAVAIVLAAFSAAADDELASFLFSDNWGNLELMAWFIAGCALVIAGVYGVREKLRGSGMPR